MEKHQGNGFHSRIRIVIADDHPIFRDGLRRLVEYEPEFELAGEAADGVDALEVISKVKPDILLLDLAMPKLSGIEVLRKLSRARLAMKTIMLTAAIDQQQITEALRLGARGVVMKESATQLLVKSIQCVLDGQYWVGRDNVSGLIAALQKADIPREAPAETYHLTAREREVINAIVEGFTNKEIASRYKISERTVKHHLSNIFDKVGVSNRLELALFSVNHSLMEEK
jgi:two-component system, NarL family, nitrate/nitrite response regulator NarL